MWSFLNKPCLWQRFYKVFPSPAVMFFIHFLSQKTHSAFHTQSWPIMTCYQWPVYLWNVPIKYSTTFTVFIFLSKHSFHVILFPTWIYGLFQIENIVSHSERYCMWQFMSFYPRVSRMCRIGLVWYTFMWQWLYWLKGVSKLIFCVCPCSLIIISIVKMFW